MPPSTSSSNDPLSALAHGLASAGVELARQALDQGRYQRALEFLDTVVGADAACARVEVECCVRLARRAIVQNDFARAERYAARALQAAPHERRTQNLRAMVRAACARRVRDADRGFFPDTMSRSGAPWWKQDLLATVRGWDGARTTVDAPLIMGEIRREHLEDIYAVGTYRPWHDGPPPRFTQYVRALKAEGRTVEQAAVLLREGLTSDVTQSAPDWIEDVDVIVPMATGWRSYELRDGLELTEELAGHLGELLCLPVVDVFERDPDAGATHHLPGYRQRLDALVQELRVKRIGRADLARARAALIIDDVVTYGATFEACARRLGDAHPSLRCYGAALAYTQTGHRAAIAEAERAAVA